MEREFEAGLERMFAQPPALPDAEAFASRIDNRLNRSWRMRGWGIGAAGVAGGVVAVTQMLGSGVLPRIQAASLGSTQAVESWYASALGQAETLLSVDTGAGLFWLVSAVLVAAAGITATRMVDEL
jgi:hypothetical protein